MASPHPNPVDQRAHERRWWTLVVLCLSLMIVFTGNSSLNVALPTLARELHATESQLQWMVAAYSLVFAGLLFSTGALGDRFGRKGALQVGLVIIFLAALSASQSTHTWQVIACRAVMGVGAALIMPSTLSILVNVFPPQERAKAIAIWAAAIGVAGSLGPLVSGVLLQHFWYGSIFLVNMPITAAAFLGTWFLVPKSKDPDQARLDPIGALLSIVGISSLVFGLIEAPDKGWTATPTLVAFAVAAVVLVVFVRWELHTDEPMLDIRFFRNRSFSTGSGGMLLVFLSVFGVMFLMTQYFQLVLGYSALEAAVRLLPLAAILVIVAPITPRLSRRFGANRVVGAGMFLIAFAFLVLTQLGLHSPYSVIIIGVGLLSVGMAMSMSPMTSAIMSAVPARRAGAGSAMNDATRELGTALGVAVLGSITASRYASHLRASLGGLPAAARPAAESSIAGALHAAQQLPAPAADAFVVAARTSFVHGLHGAAWFGLAMSLIAAVATTRFLPRTTPSHMETPVEALEHAVELGIGGVPPAYEDEIYGDDDQAPAPS